MHFLSEELRIFFLHESSIEKICCEEHNIIFYFKKGFWDENHIQKNNCRMVIQVDGMTDRSIDSFFDVIRNKRGKKRYVQFCWLQKQLKKYDYGVELEYYSEFEQSLLLEGFINGETIYIKITDINNISFLCNM